MAGTKAGGKKAAATNKARYGDDFYENIGYIGGQRGHTGGFAASHFCDAVKGYHKMARCAGILGGRISKRGRKKA